MGDADRVGATNPTSTTRRRRAARGDGGRGGARRSRAGHLHVGIERRPEGCRAHARHGGCAAPTGSVPARGADADDTKILCIFPFFWIGGTLILGAASRPASPCCASSASSRGRARHHGGGAGDHGDGLAHAHAVDARPPLFPDRKLPDIPGLTSGPADIALGGLARTRHPLSPGDERDHRQLHGRRDGLRRPRHGSGQARHGGGRAVGARPRRPARLLQEGARGGLRRERVAAHRRPRVHARGPALLRRPLHGDGQVAGGQRRATRGRAVPRDLRRGALHVRPRHAPSRNARRRSPRCSSPALGHEIDVADIQKRSQQISGYKVPTRIEIWSEADVPWLGSGKPDKIAIRSRLSESSPAEESA